VTNRNRAGKTIEESGKRHRTVTTVDARRPGRLQDFGGLEGRAGNPSLVVLAPSELEPMTAGSTVLCAYRVNDLFRNGRGEASEAEKRRTEQDRIFSEILCQ
jgi:hypothetical protein